MQLINKPYTASMRIYATIFITVVVAIVSGVLVSQKQSEDALRVLLNSSSSVKQLQGISRLETKSFDECRRHVAHLLTAQPDVSAKAQALLVYKAFHQKRMNDLINLPIEKSLLQSAFWWDNQQTQIPMPLPAMPAIEIDNATAPWLLKLSSFYAEEQRNHTLQVIEQLPIRDRDGSVLLTVLAIHANNSNDIQRLVSDWSTSYDTEAQKAALLLHALQGESSISVLSQDSEIQTIQLILRDENTKLAWRSMHRDDGTVFADIVLAGMIANPSKFIESCIATAKQNKWVHPEHAIIIASTFFPDIASIIPASYRRNDESRKKWWDLFSCGLLLQKR
jgi:hypothetical protein